MTLTARRKRRFCQALLSRSSTPLGFADVGSGGPLKAPWAYLDGSRIEKFDFEPTEKTPESLPLCVSDRPGRAEFFVARDERGSSLLPPNPIFVARFAQESLTTARMIPVMCTTLDEHFADRYRLIDAMDINVEGQDLHVLRGGVALLGTQALKLLKIEFELAHVWDGQGWFGDIDEILRARSYELVDIEIDFIPPANARQVYHRGEPVWGKALYAPCRRSWGERVAKTKRAGACDDVYKAIALYVAADLPGRSFDVIDLASACSLVHATEATELKNEICRVFRWARVEKGAELIGSVAGSALRRIF